MYVCRPFKTSPLKLGPHVSMQTGMGIKIFLSFGKTDGAQFAQIIWCYA